MFVDSKFWRESNLYDWFKIYSNFYDRKGSFTSVFFFWTSYFFYLESLKDKYINYITII